MHLHPFNYQLIQTIPPPSQAANETPTLFTAMNYSEKRAEVREEEEEGNSTPTDDDSS
jgi:hypothetical protein